MGVTVPLTRSLLDLTLPCNPFRIRSVWAHAKEMKALTSGHVDAFFANAKNKSGKLRSAFEVARDPGAWVAEQEKKDQEASVAGGVKSEED